jgi:sugar/nucleoside kinase (ribokinase family)
VFGHLTIDDTVLPDGRTAMGSLGGNALYAAIGAQLWTDGVAMVSRLGRDYPRDALDQIARAGLRTDGLVPSHHRHIRQWQLYDVDGGRMYVPLATSGTYEELAPRAMEIPEHLLEGLRGCHVAPMRLDIQGELVEWARGHGAAVTLDPHFDSVAGSVDVWRSLLPLVDIFLPSREEAQALLGAWPGAEAAARELRRWGPAAVCVKTGADGAFIHCASDRCCLRIPSAVRQPVDTTGCGDAFCGGMLAGWLESGDLPAGGLRGAVSASFAAEGFGAAQALLADTTEARRRLEELTLATT